MLAGGALLQQPKEGKEMARNKDGSVTLKTTGKVASSPKGSGAARKAPLAQSPATSGPKVTKQPGRTVVGKSAAN